MAEDERFNAFENHMRQAMGEAMGAFMQYSNSMYRDAVAGHWVTLKRPGGGVESPNAHLHMPKVRRGRNRPGDEKAGG